MAKTKTVFVCQECGSQRPKWEGQCRDCGAWNSFVEETHDLAPKNKRGWTVPSEGASSSAFVQLNQIVKEHKTERYSTGLTEFDRVLGGGLVPGSFLLLGGDPGIGKSTLLLQMGGGVAEQNHKVLYVSAEESVDQTALRAQRLGVKNSHVSVASESRLSGILSLTQKIQPQVLIIDSIQTVYMDELQSAPGTVSQVRECANQLMALAKVKNITVLLIGHITKDGHIAGPKTLEHMVDAVLQFEGDPTYQFRLLRAQKNRFGPAHELGVFQMDSQGLYEVTNPSEMFLAERGQNLIGSVVFCSVEGSRPLLCEVQALTTPSYLAMPRRTAVGFEIQRTHLLAAVLDKQLDTDFAKNDIFINVVGGLKLSEPSADLAVAAALLSTLQNVSIDARTCFFGEVGLTGEVRTTPFAVERLKEASKLGFKTAYLPSGNNRALEKSAMDLNIELRFVKHIRDLQLS